MPVLLKIAFRNNAWLKIKTLICEQYIFDRMKYRMNKFVHVITVLAFLSPSYSVFGQYAAQMDTADASECYELSEDERVNKSVYETLNESVVNITTVTVAYNWRMQPIPQEGAGSGSILDQQGRVLTNYHVIKGSQELNIRLADGTEYDGRIIGIDPESDIAIVQFDPQGKTLTTIPFGDSADLFVGQRVLAIGNPFGLDRTLTTGIISALGRPIEATEGIVLQEMIQTDASINPGNSGGPLLNTQGKMIGVNTMIYSPSGGSVGIGFAVPIDRVLLVIHQLIEHGKIARGWIDIATIQIFPQLVRFANLPVDEGLLILQVKPRSLAEKAGLRGGTRALRMGRDVIYLGGDIIVEVDGSKVTSIGDLYRALEDSKPGERVSVTIVRTGSKKKMSVTLSERVYDEVQ